MKCHILYNSIEKALDSNQLDVDGYKQIHSDQGSMDKCNLLYGRSFVKAIGRAMTHHAFEIKIDSLLGHLV